jgi:hypothetical protein
VMAGSRPASRAPPEARQSAAASVSLASSVCPAADDMPRCARADRTASSCDQGGSHGVVSPALFTVSARPAAIDNRDWPETTARHDGRPRQQWKTPVIVGPCRLTRQPQNQARLANSAAGPATTQRCSPSTRLQSTGEREIWRSDRWARTPVGRLMSAVAARRLRATSSSRLCRR